MSGTSSFLFLLLAIDNPRTADSTGSSRGDETDLFTGRSVAPHSRGLTNVLMVTTTVRVLHGVLGDTSHLWPAVSLDSEFVVGSAGFQHRFVNSSTTGDQTEHSPISARVQLFDSRGKLHSRLSSIRVVGDDCAVTSTGLGNLATIARFLLERAHDRTFRHLPDWHDVSDVELGLLAGVDELAGADAFGCDHGFGDFSVLVWVLELDFGKRSTPTWIVNNILHQTLDEALSLGIVKRSKLGGTLSALTSTRKNRASTLSLALYNAPHVCSSVSST